MATQPDQLAIRGQDGRWVAILNCDGPGLDVRRHPQPRAGRPRSRRSGPRPTASAIAPGRDSTRIEHPDDPSAALGRRVDDLRPGHRDVPCPDLLAVVQEGRAAEGQADRGGPRDGVARVRIGARGQARGLARLVVVREHDRRPAVRPEPLLVLLAGRRELLGVPALPDQLEVEDEVARRAQLGRQRRIRGREQLADRHPLRVRVDEGAELGRGSRPAPAGPCRRGGSADRTGAGPRSDAGSRAGPGA